MTISTVNDIAAGLAASQKIRSLKNITVPKAIGSMQSSWLAVGIPPAGATPPAYTAGSGYTASSATAGSLPYTNAAVKNWLAKLFAVSAIAKGRVAEYYNRVDANDPATARLVSSEPAKGVGMTPALNGRGGRR